VVEPENVAGVVAALDRDEPFVVRADADLMRQTAAQLRDQLTETEFRSCIAKGEELDGAQVIDLALDAIARAAAKRTARVSGSPRE
jgi:hypothetical protein